MKALWGLLAGDFRLVFRDTFLQFMVMYPLILGLATRFLIPVLTDRLTFLDLTIYYPLVGSAVITLQVALLGGTVVGLMVLDEKDEHTLTALQVTPLPLSTYMAYRVGLPMLFSTLGSLLVMVPLGNFLAIPPLWPMTLVAMLGALTLPIYMLFISAVARNKVQGLALTKAWGPFLALPVLAWFVPKPWQWLFGILPTFWPAKAYWLLLENEPLALHLALGVGCSLFFIGTLWLFFQRRVVNTFA